MWSIGGPDQNAEGAGAAGRDEEWLRHLSILAAGLERGSSTLAGAHNSQLDRMLMRDRLNASE
jgi:hypothetical protein